MQRDFYIKISIESQSASRVVDARMFADQQNGLLMSAAVRESSSSRVMRRRRRRRGTDARQARPWRSLVARVHPERGLAGDSAGTVDPGERQDRLGVLRRGAVVVVEAQLVGTRQINDVRRRVVLLRARTQPLLAVTRPPAPAQHGSKVRFFHSTLISR